MATCEDWLALLGYRQTAVPYHRDERVAGRTKYPLTGSLRIGLNGVVCFSSVPLQLVSAFGGLLLAAGFVTLVLWLLGVSLGWSWRVPGLVSLVLLLSGFQSLALGILGEYIGRIYDEVRERPLFLVESAHGFSRA